jgi:D-glycero-alpha-D-manno-heptose-7-phosphate kinase
MICRGRAPLRLSFAGGGTDVSPYPERFGGAVLSATIDKYAFASVRKRRDARVVITSLDYGVVAHYPRTRLRRDGTLDLVKTVVRRAGPRSGLELFLHSDAPPGTGLGSSSTMVVALLGSLALAAGQRAESYTLAERAYVFEREDAGVPGGRQDQYAAVFGGFNYIEFERDAVIVNALRIPPEVINELEYRLLLCYLGQTRASFQIIESQTAAVERGDEAVLDAMHALKAHAADMKQMLLRGRLDEFGESLHEAWETKKRLEPRMSAPRIDEMYAAARRAGALGGKMPGAGAGGFFFLLCRADRRHRVAEAVERHGGKITDFGFEPHGLMTWTAEERVARTSRNGARRVRRTVTVR